MQLITNRRRLGDWKPFQFCFIHHIWKKIEKWRKAKYFLYSKINSVRPISCANEFFKYVLYFETFLQELNLLPAFQFWELMSKNEIYRTTSCIYFMKIWLASWFSTTWPSLASMRTVHIFEIGILCQVKQK